MRISLRRWSMICSVIATLAAEPRVDQYGDPLPPHALARLGTLRFRTDKEVDTFAISPDGKTLATAEPWKVCLWDLQTGRLRHAVEVPGDYTFHLQFAPNGRTLLIETDYYARVPNRPPFNHYLLSIASVEQGKLLWRTMAYEDEKNEDPNGPPLLKPLGTRALTTAGFLADSNIVFTLLRNGGRDDTKDSVVLWDTTTGKQLDEFPDIVNVTGSLDGKTLAGGTAAGAIKL